MEILMSFLWHFFLSTIMFILKSKVQEVYVYGWNHLHEPMVFGPLHSPQVDQKLLACEKSM